MRIISQRANRDYIIFLQGTIMHRILLTVLVMMALLARTAFSKTDPFLVTPCLGVGNFTLGMNEEALLKVAENGSLKDFGKEVEKEVREAEKKSGLMRDEIRIKMEKDKGKPIFGEGRKIYMYTYPGTKITLDLVFSDFRLTDIHFFSPKFRTLEGVTLENYLYKENARYVIELETMFDGSLYAKYFLAGLSFHTRGRLSGLVTTSSFCSRR